MRAADVYIPRGAVRDYWACREREVLVEGPVRTGKSAGICEKDQVLCLHHPGLRVLWLRRYRASLTETILQLYEDHLAAWGEIANPGASRSNRMSYDFRNGSKIVCGGLDHPERIMGSEYDRISIFEATEVEQDAYCGERGVLTRLSGGAGPYNQATCDCNPGAPTHWLNQRALEGYMARVSVGFQCNPRWWDEKANDWTKAGREYVLGTLGRFQGVARARLLEGRWVQSEGVVYDTFDRKVHVRDDAPEARSVIIGIDDGYTDPFAALRIERDHDGRMHVAAEVYGSGLQTAEKIEAVRRLGGEDATIVYDAAAAQLGAELRQHFRDVLPCNKSPSVVDGIALVRDRLVVAGDGAPRLTFSPSCSNIMREIDLYEWKKRRDGSGRDEPMDQFNHALDALRYAVVHVDHAPAPQIVASRVSRDDRSWEVWR